MLVSYFLPAVSWCSLLCLLPLPIHRQSCGWGLADVHLRTAGESMMLRNPSLLDQRHNCSQFFGGDVPRGGFMNSYWDLCPMLVHSLTLKSFWSCGWCGLVDWVLACQTKKSHVWFPVRAHAWVVTQVPQLGACEKQPIYVSLAHWCFSPFLPPFPSLWKVNKQNLLKTRVSANFLWQEF